MITIVMAKVIDADHQRVWSALTDPVMRTTWDERMLAPVDAPLPDYPISGQHMRWRYLLGNVQVVLHDRPIDVEPPARFKQSIQVGSLRYEQTFTLQAESNGQARTRLGMKVIASNTIPLVGQSIDRFEVRAMATEHVNRTLCAIKEHFEPRSGIRAK